MAKKRTVDLSKAANKKQKIEKEESIPENRTPLLHLALSIRAKAT